MGERMRQTLERQRKALADKDRRIAELSAELAEARRQARSCTTLYRCEREERERLCRLLEKAGSPPYPPSGPCM